jgi:hypothetical protein
VRLLLALLALGTTGVASAACVSGGTGPSGAGDDGGVGDSGSLVQLPTEVCTGSASSCLSGTAKTKELPAPRYYVANLFGMYPAPGAPLLTRQIVAADGTWAFSALASSAHYYVEIEAVYPQSDGGTGSPVPAIVGPLAVPSAGSVEVSVAPVELLVNQTTTAAGPLVLQSALAETFDPATGAPSTGEDSVSIVVGNAPVQLPWTQIAPGNYAYYATFPATTPAQATYSLFTSGTSSWSLVAVAPSFTPAMTSPANGATVPAGQPLVVSWPAQPLADETIWTIYSQAAGGGTWNPVDTSSLPADQATTQQTIPAADVTAGPLLVQVGFLVGSCPPTADGCVVSTAITSAQIVAQ